MMRCPRVSNVRTLACFCSWALLGARRFALCEASKYMFFLRYSSGHIYKPSSRMFDLVLQEVKEADAARLRAMWLYWEQDDSTGNDAADVAPEDELHPDHRIG